MLSLLDQMLLGMPRIAKTIVQITVLTWTARRVTMDKIIS